MIPAHDNPLAAIAFNAQGTKIATASEKVSTMYMYQVHHSLIIALLLGYKAKKAKNPDS